MLDFTVPLPTTNAPIFQAGIERHRALDGVDDATNTDLCRVDSQADASAAAARSLYQSSAAQVHHDLREELRRNVLTLGDFLGCGLAAFELGQIEHGPNCILSATC